MEFVETILVHLRKSWAAGKCAIVFFTLYAAPASAQPQNTPFSIREHSRSFSERAGNQRWSKERISLTTKTAPMVHRSPLFAETGRPQLQPGLECVHAVRQKEIFFNEAKLQSYCDLLKPEAFSAQNRLPAKRALRTMNCRVRRGIGRNITIIL